jgi:uncharacterized protein (DUF58 family)
MAPSVAQAPANPPLGSGTAPPWRRGLSARLSTWLRPPRKLTFTREGKFFVGITFAVGFAAINTGNNLLYLLLGMLLSLIIASGVLSEAVLRELEVSRQLPSTAYAGTPLLVTLSVRNAKRRIPSFSIEVAESGTLPIGDKRCYFLKVPAERSQSASYRLTLPRRGRVSFGELVLATRFPFSLFRKSRLVAEPGVLVVWPARVAVPRTRALSALATGSRTASRRALSGDPAGVRDLREGEDLRDVHWRSSARRGRLMVREREEETTQRVELLIDNALAEGVAAEGEERLEQAIALSASLVTELLAQGCAVRVVVRGEGLPDRWWSGTAATPQLLTALALLPTVRPDVPWVSQPLDPHTALLVTASGELRALRHEGQP